MLEKQELEHRLKWLVNLRWIGIVGVLIATHVVRAIEFLSFSLLPVYAILGFAALYNVFFWWLLRTPRQKYNGFALSQIILDQFTLALAMYFSGGCDSPFIYFFIFHVVISGLMLSFRYTMAIASLAMLFPATVMGLKFLGILPHYGIFKEEPMLFTNLTIMASYGAAYISTLFFTAYFVAYLNKRQVDSGRELQISNIKLATLLEASRLTTSTLELEHILSESLKVVLNSTRLKVGIVLLIDQEMSRRCYDYFDCKTYDCPAFKVEVNCWMLSGTKTHCATDTPLSGPLVTKCENHSKDNAAIFDEKIKACTSCEYFASTVLSPRMSNGFDDGNGLFKGRLKVDNSTIKKALLTGFPVIGNGSSFSTSAPFTTATEIAMPLQVHQQLVGVLYLASDEAITYTDDNKAFFNLLAEVISTGVLSGRLYENLESSYLQTVTALANAIEAKDYYTRGHTERVAKICIQIADAVNLIPQEKERLQFAAILHDVGKIGISKDLLGKQSGLDEEEENAIQSHPDKGIQILEPIVFLRPILTTIRHHHEHFDGTGYPSKLKGQEIPYKARILSIADAWDAMLSNRPYRNALSVEEATRELRKNAGTQFDPLIVEAFLKTLP